ncbi:MAG: iron-sulfur cluster repair di-iron protein [Planctomycetes bacterium]|nr:iron-sulfur cluster repair di-iron protein [Planctomycetota bacterium]
MNTLIDTSRTVGDLVTEREARGDVLESLGIDFCCGGRRTLKQACREAHLPVCRVLDKLAAADIAAADAPAVNWSRASMSDLVDNIVSTHHVFLRRELPALYARIDKVCLVHGDAHPELLEIRALFRQLRRELEDHMAKEEIDVFPACKAIELRPAAARKEGLAAAIAELETEHARVGEAIHKIRHLSSGYAVPADGCRTYKLVMEGLARLEQNTHQHVHKENNILLPKARRKL